MTEVENEAELIGGKNPIVEALRAGRELNKIWIAEGLNKKGIGEILIVSTRSQSYCTIRAETTTRQPT